MFKNSIKDPRPSEIHKEVNRIERHLTSPTVGFIIGAASIGAIVYLIFLLQPQFRGDLLPYVLVIAAELFLVIQGVLAFWTILSGRHDPRGHGFHHSQDHLLGNARSKRTFGMLLKSRMASRNPLQLFLHDKAISVSVFIPVYGEPVEEIRQTAIAAKGIYGKHDTYILDDGKSDEVREMAGLIGVKYIRRPNNDHAKAGNINYALSQTESDLFVILDADFVVSPMFLYETVPFFYDEKLSFVQTPQHYQQEGSFVSIASGHMQHVFYSLVQSGKNRFNAAFCVGTNVVFRRSAIEAIGGIYDKSKSEDIWTSLKLHENGYKSVYINKVLAIGKTPDTLKAYSKQQLRWATGSFEIFIRHNPLLNKKLTMDQRLQYFATTSFYFNGFAVGVLLLLPVLQIYFNLTPIALDIPLIQWLALYSGFYILQIVLSSYIMGSFKLQTLIISAASFPIYLKSFVNVLIGRDTAWQATNSVDTYDSPFNYVRMQVYIFVFLLATTVVGIWKSVYTMEFSVSIVWATLNMLVFGYFVFAAMGENRRLRKGYASKKSTNEPLAVRSKRRVA